MGAARGRPWVTLAVAVVVILGALAVVGGGVDTAEAPLEESHATRVTPDASLSAASTAAHATARTRPGVAVPPSGSTGGSAAAVRRPNRPVDETDLLQVHATDAGAQLRYEFVVRGAVQRTRVDDRVAAGRNDEVVDNGDGTVTVRGTTANEFGDAYLVTGEVLSFRQTGGESGYDLILNGLSVTADTLVEADVLEVVSTDAGERLTYTVTVRGTVTRTATSERVAATGNDRIVDNGDGTVTVRGATGNQFGDAYLVRGEIRSLEQTGGDSGFFVRVDGLLADPAAFGEDTDPGGDTDSGDDTESDGDTDPGDDTDTGGDSGATVLESCTVIDTPGRYVLARDVENATVETCFDVTADDVVLDGRGHVVDGESRGGYPSETVGVRVTGANVTVRDVTVTDWGWNVHYLDAAGGVLENATVDFTRPVSDGVLVERTTGLAVRHSRVVGSDVGMVVRDSTELVLRNNSVGSAGDAGLVLRRSHRNRLVGNVAPGPGVGIELEASHGNVLRDNRATGDEGGIGLVRSHGNLVVGNEAGGTGVAIRLRGARENELLANTVHSDLGTGIDLRNGSNENLVAANTVLPAAEDSPATGINVAGSAGNTVRGNLVAGHENGVVLTDATGNVLERNTVRDNARYGVVLRDADENTVVDNDLCENGAGTVLVDGDSSGNVVTGTETSCE